MNPQNNVIEKTASAISRVVDDANTQPGKLVEKAGDKLEEIREKTMHVLHEANNTTLADVEKKAGDFVREHPGRTIAIAAVAGLLVGFFMRHR